MSAEEIDEETELADVPVQHVSFLAAGEQYAVSLLEVREIVQYTPVTRVPGVAPFLHGVTNLRGKVVPVIDLAVRLGLPPSKLGARSCVVMLDVTLDGEPAVVGLLVDSMSRILELERDDIEPPPTFGTVAGAGLLRGMAKEDSRFVLLLEVSRLISAEVLELPLLAEEPKKAKKPRKPKKAAAEAEPSHAPPSPAEEPPAS